MAGTATEYRSPNPWRAELVRTAISAGRSSVNGLDSVAVDPPSGGGASRAVLALNFLRDPGPLNLRIENLVIEAADGTRPFRISGLSSAGSSAPLQLKATVDGPIDSAAYALRLVSSPTDSHPPSGLDPLLAGIPFFFLLTAALGADEVDVAADVQRPPAEHIDYLAKDFYSFQRLMFDRLAVLRPDWQERHAADLGVALVELLAYAADQASYYQDAVATEAYLATARRRISVRRHARLLDYHMHDGRNARVWIAVTAQPGVEGAVLAGPSFGSADQPPRPGTQFLTQLGVPRVVPSTSDLDQAAAARAQLFEAMHDLKLFAANNEIPIYTWGQPDAVLPRGSTQATLIASNLRTAAGASTLGPGDLLLLEERAPADCPSVPPPDASHRQVVRLLRVTAQQDPLFEDLRNAGQPLALLQVEWMPEDALSFDLCLSEVAEDRALAAPRRRRVAVARGNIVLADHGQTLPPEELRLLPGSATRAGYDYGPLGRGPVTQQGHMMLAAGGSQPLDMSAPASAAMGCALGSVHPAVSLSAQPGGVAAWRSRRDLLESAASDQEFVVEVDDEGRAHPRFGNGTAGKQPLGSLYATYRIGNGREGNVGAESIAHVLLPPPRLDLRQVQASELGAVRNPLPAVGGEDPESIADVKQRAPQAYRVQLRAVTADDYAALLLTHPEVREARASRRFTGSWYTLFLYVDRRAGLPVDASFRRRLLAFLEPYRMAGHDLHIEGPRYVPLELALTVTAVPSASAQAVRTAVLATLSADELPGGRRGFFHPDSFGFGQPLYLSQLLSAVTATADVAAVRVQTLRRYGDSAASGLVNQRINLGSQEIVRLNFRTSLPSRDGALDLRVEGGR